MAAGADLWTKQFDFFENEHCSCYLIYFSIFLCCMSFPKFERIFLKFKNFEFLSPRRNRFRGDTCEPSHFHQKASHKFQENILKWKSTMNSDAFKKQYLQNVVGSFIGVYIEVIGSQKERNQCPFINIWAVFFFVLPSCFGKKRFCLFGFFNQFDRCAWVWVCVWQLPSATEKGCPNRLLTILLKEPFNKTNFQLVQKRSKTKKKCCSSYVII